LKRNYDQTYKKSISTPEKFWEEAAEDIVWFRKYEKVLDKNNPPFYKWFIGGKTNGC